MREAQAEAKAKLEHPKGAPAPDKSEGPPAIAEPPSAAPPPVKAGVDEPEPPALIASFKALRRAKPDAEGFLNVRGKGVVGMKLGEPSAERAITFLMRFAGEAAAQGHALERSEAGVRLVISGEPLAFRLEEKPLKVAHIPTPKELKRKADWVRWGDDRDPWPPFDDAPSGKLSFGIDGESWSGLRRTFADGKVQRLERMIPAILVAFAAHAALIQERRREREERERQWAEEETKRAREKAFGEREARRMAFDDAVVAKLDERAKLALVLAHVEQVPKSQEWLPETAAWLRDKLAETDAVLGARFLDISAQHARVDFDEMRANQAEHPSRYYPRDITLHLWDIDEEEGEASTVSPVQWRERRVQPARATSCAESELAGE